MNRHDDELDLNYCEMGVAGFALDGTSQLPLVILRGRSDDRTMAVPIQPQEILTLGAELVTRTAVSRHDLLTTVLGRLGYVLERLTVDDLKEDVYAVTAHFGGGSGSLTVAVGMAEALAVSLRLKTPLLVAEDVLDGAALAAGSRILTADGDTDSRYAELLERLDPAALGKYPL